MPRSVAHIRAIILARCNLAARLARARVRRDTSACKRSFFSRGISELSLSVSLSLISLFLLRRSFLPAIIYRWIHTHSAGPLLSFHSTGIIAKPQRIFFRAAPSTQLRCAWFRVYAGTYVITCGNRPTAKSFSRAGTSSQIVLRARGTLASPHSMHSVRTNAGISNGPERVSSVGRVARRKSEHESKEERNGEKVVESDACLYCRIITRTMYDPGIARPRRLNCDQGLNGDSQGRRKRIRD